MAEFVPGAITEQAVLPLLTNLMTALDDSPRVRERDGGRVREMGGG